MYILILSLFIGVGTSRADECDGWGEVTPAEVSVQINEEREFYITKGSLAACGDSDLCSWSLSNNSVGTLLTDFGSPVVYQAPSRLDGCVSVTFELFVECEDENTFSAANVSVNCTDEAKAALLLDAESITVGGGGCNSPTGSMALFLVFPVGLLLGRRNWW